MRIIFYSHLGLGDHMICNGLVRDLAKQYDITVIAKHHNVASCRYMWSDLTNITVQCVSGDKEAELVCESFDNSDSLVFRHGMHHLAKPFDITQWDREFYRQANVPFAQSWDGWKVPECKTCIEPIAEPYAFVHDDPDRVGPMNMKAIPYRLCLMRNRIYKNKHIFEWTEVLRNATEIHCMESCFAILVDRLDGIKARRLVMHAYMRNSRPPVYRKNWEILT